MFPRINLNNQPSGWLAAVFKYPPWLGEISVYVHLGHKIHLNLKFMHDCKEGVELGNLLEF